MADIVNPKVSIVIPISNYVEYLGDCLRSIITQTYENIEIICVDNCTNPEAVKIVEEYRAKDSRIVYEKVSDAPISKLKNKGMDCASGMFMMFVQPSDFIEVDMVAGILRTAAKNVSDITFCATWEHDNNTKNRVIEENSYYTMSWFPTDVDKACFSFADIQKKLVSFPAMCWAKLYNVEFLRRVGARFPESLFYEDDLFFMNLIYNAKKMAFDSRQLYDYRVNCKMPVAVGYEKHYADILDVMEEVERILKLFPVYAEIEDEFFVYSVKRILKELETADKKVKRAFYKKIQQKFLCADMIYAKEALLEKAGCANTYNIIRNDSYLKYKMLSGVKKFLKKKSQ